MPQDRQKEATKPWAMEKKRIYNWKILKKSETIRLYQLLETDKNIKFKLLKLKQEVQWLLLNLWCI